MQDADVKWLNQSSEHEPELSGGKKYFIEMTEESSKTCALKYFVDSLDFVRETEKFRIADLQRYLQCGLGMTYKVLDALNALCVIEKIQSSSGSVGCMYRSLIKK